MEVQPQSGRVQRRQRVGGTVGGTCPECSKKLPLGALIVHLNDAHHWTRERIAHAHH